MNDILKILRCLEDILDAVNLRGIGGSPDLELQFLIEKLLQQLHKNDGNMPTTLHIQNVLFTKESLRKILKLMGFQVDKIGEIPHYSDNRIDYIVALKDIKE